MTTAQTKLDKQMFFVAQTINKGITKNVGLAAIWFRDEKGWLLTTTEALEKFKQWLPTEGEPA